MRFASASAFILPFGHCKDLKISDVAESDDGLRYLDNLLGKLDSDAQKGKFLNKDARLTRDAVASYLRDPAIEAEVNRLVATA